MLSTKINKSVKELLNFAGDNVTRNLVTASRQRMIEISENDLRKVSAIVERSMEQTLINGYTNVKRAVEETLTESKSHTSLNSKGKKKR